MEDFIDTFRYSNAPIIATFNKLPRFPTDEEIADAQREVDNLTALSSETDCKIRGRFYYEAKKLVGWGKLKKLIV